MLVIGDSGSSWCASSASVRASGSLPPIRPMSFGVPMVGRCIVRIELKSLLIFSLASSEVPLELHLVAAQNGMGTSQGRIQLQCFTTSGIRLRIVFARAGAVDGQYGIGISQPPNTPERSQGL